MLKTVTVRPSRDKFSSLIFENIFTKIPSSEAKLDSPCSYWGRRDGSWEKDPRISTLSSNRCRSDSVLWQPPGFRVPQQTIVYTTHSFGAYLKYSWVCWLYLNEIYNLTALSRSCFSTSGMCFATRVCTAVSKKDAQSNLLLFELQICYTVLSLMWLHRCRCLCNETNLF